MQALPHTRIPCFYPSLKSGPIDARTVHVKVENVVASEAAFAQVLRVLLGGTGEFTFHSGNERVVWVAGLEDDRREEKLTPYDASLHGLELIEAKLSCEEDNAESAQLENPIHFHIQVRPTSVTLTYSAKHIPQPLAHRLLDLYTSCAKQEFSVAECSQLSIVNYPPRAYPNAIQKHVLLHEAFIRKATKHPNNIAIDFLGSQEESPERQSLTYGELDQRSLKLARFLCYKLGTDVKSIIPLALPPSIELYVGYLGVLRSGNAFCPLPGHDNAPAERLLELVQDVGARVVLGRTSRPTWLQFRDDIEWIDMRELDAWEDESHAMIWKAPCHTDLAYVLFTSGSTGKPKGVQITHLAVAASIASHLSVRPLPKHTRWFQFAASTFDPSLMEIFINFSSGTTICGADRRRFLTDPEAVLRELRCSHMMATPSMAAMLRPEKIGDKFELWTMGEKLTDRVIKIFSRPEDGYVLCNAYGPTEAAINVTLRVHPKDESGARLGPPIPTAAMVILDPNESKLMPMGFPGELGLVGVQLAKGYLDTPEQTAKVFVNIEGVGRVYRTGDRGRIVVDERGEWTCIEYLGRMGTEQVKLSGRRVELGEIDAVLSAASGITAAHAVVVNDQLYALLTPANVELISHAKTIAEHRLQAHMRPAAYHLADVVPQSAAGKADRRAIAKLISTRLAEDSCNDHEDATNETLAHVVKLVAEAADIKRDTFNVAATLLSLGIDSLRGVKFLRLAREAGLHGLLIQDLLGQATPISVAHLVVERRGLESKIAASNHRAVIERFAIEAGPAIRQQMNLSEDDEIPHFLPTTPMQSSILAVWLRGETGYINHSIYTLSPDVDIPRLKKAWQELVRRNAILRMFFVLVDNSTISPFAQIVQDDVEVSWIETGGASAEGVLQEHLRDVTARINLRTPLAVALLSSEDEAEVRFALTLHHSLFDGGSLALMLEELWHIYTDSPETLNRKSFEHAVIDVLNVDLARCTEYWTKELKGYVPESFPDLSGLRQESKAAGYHVSTIISSTAFSQLRNGACSIQATPLTIVQAAWGLLLLTYSESEPEDIVFGSVVGGRTSEELEFTVGPVLSTVPIRMCIAGHVKTKDIISQLLNKNSSNLVHRYPPVNILSGENGIIYDTTVALQNFGEGLSQTDLWTEATYPPMETEFAVVLEIWIEQDDSIRLRATCSNNVLVPSASEAMLYQFDDIMSTLLSDDYQDRAILDVMSGVRPSLLSSVNSSPARAPIPHSTLIHHQFEQNVRSNPDAIAVWFKQDLANPETDIRLTYRELDQRGNRLANYLVDTFGDLRDRAIPICMEKSVEMYIAILGIVKAGGAWCPIDFAAPEKRKRDLFVRAGGPTVIVRDQKHVRRLQAEVSQGFPLLALDDSALLLKSDDAPVVDIKPSHLAYLIWTSGTTGSPKGVPIEHVAASQALSVLREVIPFDRSGVRCLNFSAYTFDVSILDVFYALGAPSGTLCSSTKELLFLQFPGVVKAFGATHAFLTPAFMAQSALKEFPSLQALISIGEKLPDSVADKWCCPGVVSLNTYGPAEATIIATYRRFQPGEVTKAQNVGFPIQTVSCHVIKDGRVVPRGAVGELVLGGYQNARGYHMQPDMTAKKFINHPVCGKVYKTGDIVRILHDGSCEFVGRNDDLVKLGGIRVELSEISAALKTCDSLVRDATTLMLSRLDRPQKVVCTFLFAPSLMGTHNICTGEEAVAVARSAKKSAEQYLPPFMHPTVIMVLKSLPLTSSNKVDRKALTELYVSLDISRWEALTGDFAGDSDSWSSTEDRIRSVASELTGTSAGLIKKTTPFTALGIDSIRALQFASRLQKIELNITALDVLAHSTIERLSRYTDAQGKTAVESSTETLSDVLRVFDASWRPAVEVVHGDVERVLPCTPLQEGMLGETVKNPAAYWSHRLLTLREDIVIDRLKHAWEVVTSHTEVLRVAFLPAAIYASAENESDAMPIFLQVLFKTALVVCGVEHCSNEDVSRRSRELAKSIVQSWSDSHRPPWTVTLFEENAGHLTMMLSMHHSLYDGDAIEFLLEDVQLAYHGASLPSRLQLSGALSTSFFAHDAGKSQIFWEETLRPFANADSSPWPTLLDYHPDQSDLNRFFSSTFACDRSSLSQLASKLNVSISHVLQAAWSTVLSAYMTTDKVVFGETLSLRMGVASLEQAIAPLITTTPVVAQVTDTKTPRTLMTEISLLARRSARHRLVSTQRIRNVLQRHIDQPVFPAIFVIYINEGASDSFSTTLKPYERLWQDSSVASLSVEHPLAVNVYVNEKEVKADVLGSGAYMSQAQTDLLAQQFEAVLLSMSDRLDDPIRSVLVALEDRFLSILRPSMWVRPAEVSLTYWLEHWASVTPEKLALVATNVNDSLTFGALDKAVNRVGHWIRQQRPEASVVACCLPVSRAAVIYQLGVFKSGNTYLAIDPSLPSPRKRLIARASKTTLILTTTECRSEFEGLGFVVPIDEHGHVHDIDRSCDDLMGPRDASSPACLIFTNESDRPSRVSRLSRRAITSMVDGLVQILPESLVDAKFFNWMPPSLDVQLAELLLPIRLGLTMWQVAEKDLKQDLIKTINASRPTHAILPAAWLLKQGVRGQDVPSLKCVLLLGLDHKAPLDVVEGGDINAISVFGLSETSGICATFPLRRTPIRMIGHPLAPTIVTVMRPGSLDPALRGEIGELYVGGDALLDGNLRGHRDDPIDTVYGPIWNTRIMGRILANGAIQYIGHQDDPTKLHQVSQTIRDSSIQPLNVHSATLAHPQGLSKYTATFVSRSWNPADDSSSIYSERDSSLVRSLHLLGHKRNARCSPDVVVPLNVIPISHILSGRVNDRALRRLFSRLSPDLLLQQIVKSSSVRALDHTEDQLRRILSTTTGISDSTIRAETSTLELGIDSLMAISLSFRLKAAGFHIPPHVILSGPTLAVLAKSSRSPVRSVKQSASLSVEETQRIRERLSALDVKCVWRSLPLQEGLIARTLNSEQPVYVNHFILRIGSVDLCRLRAAFDDTIRANDILRTCFYAGEKNIYQIVLTESPEEWKIVNGLDNDPLVVLHDELRQLEKDVVTKIGMQPPLRLSYFTGPQWPAYVVLTMHHALYDGESLPMILSEVRARYSGTFNTVRTPISSLLDYVHSQSEDAAQAFFVQYLRDIPKLSTSLSAGVPVRHELKPRLSLSQLERTSRALNLNIHTLLLASYGIALGELQKVDDNVLGVVLSGRSILVEGIDTMLAPCITTVPIRVQMKESQLFTDIAHRLQAETTAVFEHQHTPLRLIQRWVDAGSLFTTLFNFTRAADAPEHDLWTSMDSKTALEYPMAVAVEASVSTDDITIRAGNHPSFASSHSVKRLLRRMEDLLSNPHQPVERQLPPSSVHGRPSVPSYSQEWSEQEHLIRRLVAKVCQVDLNLVNKDTSFLHLGIDSITSIRLSQELRDEELAVPTYAIMQNPCVGALADFLRHGVGSFESVGAQAQRNFNDIQRTLEKYHAKITLFSDQDTVTSIFPATPLQTGMLALSVSHIGRLYTVSHAFQLSPDVSAEGLRAAWQAVVNSTDILRCSFLATGDSTYPWIGAVHHETTLQWKEHDVGSDGDLRRLAQDVERSVAFEDEQSFQRPPLSFHLLKSPSSRVLIAVMHHSLYDGLSISYILEDIVSAYRGVAKVPRPQFLSAVPYILQSSRDEDHFWQTRLAGYRSSHLRKGAPGDKSTTHLAETALTLSRSSLVSIRTMGVTIQAVALLAWGKTLSTLVDSSDVVFGQVVAGRSIELNNSLRVSGPLFNTIPYRFTLSDPMWSNAEAAYAQHALNVQAEPRQHVPLREIQKKWRVDAMCGDDLFDTLFVFQQRQEKSDARSTLWSPYKISDEASSAQYPLNLEIVHAADHLEVRSGCQGNVFSQRDLQDVVNLFRDTLEDIVLHPDELVTAFPPRLQDINASQAALSPKPSPGYLPRGSEERNATPTEETLRDICSLVCNIPREKIGPSTPLYAIGMDSIAAIQVAAKCRTEHGLQISVADIFTGETISGIASAYDDRPDTATELRENDKELVSAEERSRALSILGVKEGEVEDVLPVLAGQHFLLTAWLKSGGTFYQPVFAYKITNSKPDFQRLQRAWEALKARHSILRTVFVATSPSTAIQVVLTRSPKNRDWTVVDAEGWEEFDAQVKRQVKAEYGTASDLFTPPARATLVRGSHQSVLLLSLHHATYDAWSVGQLIADLNALYDASTERVTSTTNFAELVRHIHNAADEQAEKHFWESALQGSMSTLLPQRIDVPLLKQVFTRASGVVMSADEVHLRCQANGSSLQAVVLCVWGRITRRLTGNESPILGVYHTGRAAPFEGLDVLAGPCVNVLPMQVPGGNAREATRYVQGQLGKRTIHEHSDLRNIVKRLGYDGPLFNVFVNLLWHGDKLRSVRLDDAILKSYSVGIPTDFIADRSLRIHSAVDGLDASYIPEAGLYIDVVLNAQTNSLGLALRCNASLMMQAELDGLIGEFANGVTEVVDELD